MRSLLNVVVALMMEFPASTVTILGPRETVISVSPLKQIGSSN